MDIVKKQNKIKSSFHSPQGNSVPSASAGSTKPLYKFPRKHPQRSSKKIFFVTLGCIFFVGFLFSLFLFFKLHQVSQKITLENGDNLPTLGDSAKSVLSSLKYNKEDLRGFRDGRINILLLGIAGEGKPGGNLTDTIMIASINTKTNRVALLSLPRDLYAAIPETDKQTKINSIYQYGINSEQGIEPLLKTIEKITDIPLHYFVVLNFDGFRQIINDVGGVTVTNERDIYDPKYPGPNYSYELFELKKGVHNLNGDLALKYARQRHNDPEGDFGRSKRQQQVIQAFKNKVFSTKTLLNVFTVNKLIDTLGNNIKTDISIEEVEAFMSLAKEVDTQNISNSVVDAWKEDSLLKVSHIYYDNIRAFILIPRAGNYSEIQELAQNIFDLEVLKKRKENIEKENSKILVVSQDRTRTVNTKIKALLNNLGIKNVTFKNNDALPEKTTVTTIGQSQSLFTLDEIIKKLPATLSTESISQEELKDVTDQYDLIVFIGKDLEKVYDYEESNANEMNEVGYDQIYIDLLNQ